MSIKEYRHIQPSPMRVAIKLAQTEERSAGGLYLPGGRQEIAHLGEVVAICTPYRDESGNEGPIYRLGDRVLFGKYSGSEIMLDRDKYVVVYERDILATLHTEEELNADGTLRFGAVNKPNTEGTGNAQDER